jgi:hypothetical protein
MMEKITNDDSRLPSKLAIIALIRKLQGFRQNSLVSQKENHGSGPRFRRVIFKLPGMAKCNRQQDFPAAKGRKAQISVFSN